MFKDSEDRMDDIYLSWNIELFNQVVWDAWYNINIWHKSAR